MYVCLSVYLSGCLYVCMPMYIVHLYIYIYTYIYRYIYIYIDIHIHKHILNIYGTQACERDMAGEVWIRMVPDCGPEQKTTMHCMV